MLPSATADVAGIGDFVNDLTSNLRHLMETSALEESRRGARRMQSAATRKTPRVLGAAGTRAHCDDLY
jgi:hypothetical protein